MDDRALTHLGRAASMDTRLERTAVGRCLVVANQTLGGPDLDESIRERIARGTDEFHVVVPMTAVQHEAGWSGGFLYAEGVPVEAIEAAARQHEADVEDSRRRAEDRLGQMVERIRAAGGHADGEVGASDPLDATRDALERDGHIEEIIVSTLPSRLSRWLRMDVPSRVARLSDVPVTTIEAAE
jgi:nucleotide-binding universal stress UspA family protein